MSGMRLEEAMDFIEENDVKFIRLAFCDYYGNHKNVSIMPDEFLKAVSMGEPFDSFRIYGFDDQEHQDLFLKPDLSTLCILPWRPQEGRVVRFYCDIVDSEGVPYSHDPRKILQDAISECRSMGFKPNIGLNSEFYLFRTDEEGNPTNIPWDRGGYFDIAPLDRGENIRREICLTMEEMGIQPCTSHHETGPGQNEIDFAEDSALHTADNFITYKNVVGAVSARNGIYASFAPKPIPEESGNGLHVKVSLLKDGENLWKADEEMANAFTAGVLNRMRDITLFLNTERESYERFGQNEAPKYITWSVRNRSRLLRMQMSEGMRNGFILRSPDSGINPYIAFSMILKAGLAGIKNHEILPDPLEKSSRYISEEERSSYTKLPLSLDEAIDCAKNSTFIAEDEGLKGLADRFIHLLKEKD